MGTEQGKPFITPAEKVRGHELSALAAYRHAVGETRRVVKDMPTDRTDEAVLEYGAQTTVAGQRLGQAGATIEFTTALKVPGMTSAMALKVFNKLEAQRSETEEVPDETKTTPTDPLEEFLIADTPSDRFLATEAELTRAARVALTNFHVDRERIAEELSPEGMTVLDRLIENAHRLGQLRADYNTLEALNGDPDTAVETANDIFDAKRTIALNDKEQQKNQD